ncbi:MAG: hypothetical protein ACRDZT_09470 [Acidimicrobiales bacterium]
MRAPISTDDVDTARKRFPPVAELGTACLALVVVGGILLASYAPRRPPLTIPIALLCASGLLLIANVTLLSRAKHLAWDKFFLVGRWALIAYVVAAAMIEFAFVRDHTRGAPLIVITLLLVIFAIDVPLIISFTVGRYQAQTSQ